MEQTRHFNTVGDFVKKEINLFYCDVQKCRLQSKQIFSLLNTEDCERFVAFKKTLSQYQFGLARSLVKQVLFDYFDIPLDHKYTLNNFCEWVVIGTKSRFYISISHSKNLVAIAISLDKRNIGVDIEYQKDRNFSELITVFACENEKKLFNESADKKQMFYRLWTAKEAYIKAFQMTLSELSRIDLSSYLHNNDNNSKCWLHQQPIENNEYYVSLISDGDTVANLQKVFI